jgi:hypothetical protein
LEAGAVTSPVPWQLQVARFLAPAIAAYAATAALLLVFREQAQLLRLRCVRDHVVVCGLGKKGLHLAREFHEAGYRITIIEKSTKNENLPSCREHGIITLIGDATDRRQLIKAGAHRARYLFAVSNDGTNAEVAVLAQKMAAKRRKGILTCFVHIVELQLFKLLREKGILEQRSGLFRLEFFNIFESGARALLNEFPPFGRPGEAEEHRAHILIVGLGHMGDSLVMRAVRDWRDLHKADGKRLKITIVDPRAESLKKSLFLEYPQIDGYCDLIARQMEVQTSEFRQAGFLFDPHAGDVTMVYVCLDDDSLGLSSAIALHQRIREQGTQIPIVVRMSEDAGLARFLPRKDEGGGEFENLHAFGLLDRTCRPDLVVSGVNETLARAIHEGYVNSEAKKGETPETNPSMVPWDSLAENLRESNRHQADHFIDRIEAFGYRIVLLTDWDAEGFEFSPEEVEGMAEKEHQRWYDQKLTAGYRFAPGPKTDETHPDLVPWSRLAKESKEKDREMVRELPRYLAKAGFQVQRIPKPVSQP